MNRVDRLFGILILLQSRKYVTADAIAERFDISIRTVYRDVRALSDQGVPVHFEPQRGYSILKGFFLPPVSFTTEEANALLLLEPLVGGLADKSIAHHYASALAKIRSVLHTNQRDAVDALQQRVKIQLPQRFYQESTFLASLQQAVSARHAIEIDYVNAKEERSRRTIEPIGLVFYAFGWHVIGWCRLRQAYRDFKVSRLTGLSCTGESFTKADHMDLADYMQHLPVNF